MPTYTILGTETGYQKRNSYKEARDLATEQEAKGRRVEIVEDTKGSLWTVYKTPEHVVAPSADGGPMSQAEFDALFS